MYNAKAPEAGRPAPASPVPAMLRVLFVCHSREIGGSELYLEQIATRMAAEAGVRVLCRPDAALDGWAERFEASGIPVTRLALSGPGDLARLRREVRRASVVHLSLANRVGSYQALVTLACRLERRPLVCTHHLARETEDLPFGPLGRRFRALALGAVYRPASCHIAVSADGLALLPRRAGLDARRVVQVSNGVDLERHRPPAPARRRALRRRLLGVEDDGTVVCCTVARLTPQKGLDVLLDAAALLRRSGHAEVRFVVVGGGELHDVLRARTTELDLGDTVRLAGERPPAEIPDWLAAADVFVLPSHYEGMSLAVMEAMATGLPVVVTRVSGTAELVPDAGHGRVVAPGDAAGLAGAIAGLLPDAGLRRSIGARALERVRSLSWDACFARTSELLRAAAAG